MSSLANHHRAARGASGRLRHVLAEPLLHWLVLAALAIGLRPALETRLAPETLLVSRAEIAALGRQWRADMGHAVTPAQLDGLIRQHVDETILLREALRHGLDRDDPVVVDRMVQNMRFIDPDTRARAPELLDQARDLGMVYRDPVVRRRLSQRVRQQIETTAVISEAQITEYMSANPELTPPRYSFEHVYFSSDRLDPAGAAAAAIGALTQTGAGSKQFGEPFMLGHQFNEQSAADIDRLFGPGFADAVTRLEPGFWSRPIASAYGLHLVRVHTARPAQPLEPDAHRRLAVQALTTQSRDRQLQLALERLRQRYRIVIEAAEHDG